jgi:three-Cys-motif partner protein
LRDRRFASVERALFFDNEPDAAAILQRRIDAVGQAHKAQALVGDYNDPGSMLKRIKETCRRGLYLILVDPTRCDVPFATITTLKNELYSTDFLVNVALGTDFNRCARQVVLDPGFAETRARYERFLGTERFLAGPDVMAACDRPEALRRLFARRYLESMRGIGLKYADTKPVRQYYYLLFASGDARGLEFWRKACKHDPSGQGILDL